MGKTEAKEIPLIALTGYSRSGKDTAADHLVSLGYERRAFGDIIKGLVRDAGPTTFRFFKDWLLDTGRNQLRISEIAYGWSLVKLCGVDPFTQDDEVKPNLRALLEDYGIYRYDEVTRLFFSTLPSKCVNSRLCRAQEAREWRDRGGVLVEVVRPGGKPHTDQERRWVEELHEAGAIDTILKNDDSIDRLNRAIALVASGKVGGIVSAESL
jgi:hypothetical protein